MLKFKSWTIALVALMAAIAFAAESMAAGTTDNEFVTPGNLPVESTMPMQLNAAGKAIPTGIAAPLPVIGNTNIPTYSASASFSNSSAGDAFCVNGSATKTINVKDIRVTAIASALVTQNIALIRRSTQDTGGGKTAITIVPSDSSDAAGTGTASYFTTAPTAGTPVGHIRDRMLTVATASTGPVSEGLFQFSVYWDQPQVLRGTAQGLCVSVPSTAGGTWSISTEWSEQ